MPTATQLLGLIKSHANGDEGRFHALTLQLAASEDRKGHRKVAEELRRLADQALERKHSPSTPGRIAPPNRPTGELSGLIAEARPKTRMSQMVLPGAVSWQLERIIEEQRQRWKLREHSLSPRNKLLLAGPPGSGKTMTAAVLAGELGLPLFTVLLHGVITKFMGETAAKLRLIFDEIARTRGVYLFDEIDALGGHRGADNDVGEARRILNSFLQFLEEQDGESLIVATTNHRELLDRALFRRFHLVLEYKLPERPLIVETLRLRLLTFDTAAVNWNKVAEAAEGLSNADIIRAAEDAARQAILTHGPVLDTDKLLSAVIERRDSILGDLDAGAVKSSSRPRASNRQGGTVPGKRRR